MQAWSPSHASLRNHLSPESFLFIRLRSTSEYSPRCRLPNRCSIFLADLRAPSQMSLAMMVSLKCAQRPTSSDDAANISMS
jgi:hypothetical protein